MQSGLCAGKSMNGRNNIADFLQGGMLSVTFSMKPFHSPAFMPLHFPHNHAMSYKESCSSIGSL